MRVLMFGWEFPPHISGGLGTACWGISNSLSKIKDIDLTFVVPKADKTNIESFKLLSANQVSLNELQEKKSIPFHFFEIDANLIPYTSVEEYDCIQKESDNRYDYLIETSKSGTIKFNPNYGANLFNEVLKYAVAARQIASESSYDIIHAHDWMSFPAGIEAQKQTGQPLIVHIHSTEFDRNRQNINPAIYAIEKEGMLAAETIITVSEYSKQQLIDKYEIDAKKIKVLYNGIDIQKKSNTSKAQKHFEEKLITFLGRITEQKGPEYFIKAAYEILQNNKSYRFVMAGDGNLKPQMVELVAKLGISDRFHFTNFLSTKEVQQLFSISDAYVLPSSSEPFGISVLEAIEYKIPVIVSKKAGVTEVINNLYKIDFGNTNSLADGIIKLTNNNSTSNSLTKNAFEELKKLSWGNAALQLYKIYLEATKNDQNL